MEVDLTNAKLTGCRIYGISAWNVKLKGAEQSNLIISPANVPVITVDNLEVAQFIYVLLHNEKARDVIDTITAKAVLILGRFTEERKAVLEAIRDELRQRDYLPILFDFDKPSSKSFIDTVGTLAQMSRFVIADMTDPKIVLQEVPYILSHVAVPVQPLFLKGSGFEPVTLYEIVKTYSYAYSSIGTQAQTRCRSP